MQKEQLMEALKKLLPSEFEEIVFRLGVLNLIPGGAARPIDRIQALLDLLEKEGRLQELVQTLGVVFPQLKIV